MVTLRQNRWRVTARPRVGVRTAAWRSWFRTPCLDSFFGRGLSVALSVDLDEPVGVGLESKLRPVSALRHQRFAHAVPRSADIGPLQLPAASASDGKAGSGRGRTPIWRRLARAGSPAAVRLPALGNLGPPRFEPSTRGSFRKRVDFANLNRARTECPFTGQN